MQEFSIANQEAAISAFAARSGYKIVMTYSDAGRSGVSARRRPGLCKLLSDVINGNADFKAILVYDVSRWGRFQNYDEAGHYEFLCHQAGVPIYYCAEPFGSDGSILSGLMKNLKRIMASEYSRELGVKTFAGQARLATEGFKIGGRAGFGLRRMMISCDGERRRILKPREFKGVKTDRVVYVPGPEQEVRLVRRIYSMALQGLGYSAIAEALNRRRVVRENGAYWNYEVVKDLLTNPKYMGCNTWGRTSQKLHGPSVQITREKWIARPNAFAALIKPHRFSKVQQKLKRYVAGLYWTDEELLAKLVLLRSREGKLTSKLLDHTPGMPNSGTVARRFGNLRHAYQLIGYAPQRGTLAMCTTRTQTYHLRNCLIRKIEGTCSEFTSIRLPGRLRPKLLLDGKVIVSIKICPAQRYSNAIVWDLSSRPPENDTITLVCRCQPGSSRIHSLYVVPKREWKTLYRFTGEPQWLKEGVRLKNFSELPHAVRSLTAQKSGSHRPETTAVA